MTFPFGGQNSANLTQIMNVLQNIVTALGSLTQTVSRIFPLGLTSSVAWTPGAITSGSQVTTTVTVAGAILGMSAQAAFSADIQGLIMTAYVSAANTVKVVLTNETGSTVTIGAGTVTVWARSN